MSRLLAVVVLGCVIGGCSPSNNLFLGRVEAPVAGRTVVVTDCYRTSVPQPVTDTLAGVPVARFTPCRDADVVIRLDSVIVNGRPYGPVAPGDTIVVDHGVVRLGR